jgi:Na+/proline symporter
LKALWEGKNEEIAMGLLAVLVLLALIVFFVILRFSPAERQGELLELMGGFAEVIGVNIILTIVLLLVCGVLSSNLKLQMSGCIGAIGIVQLIYAVGRSLHLRRQRKWSKLKGTIAGSVLVALLNGGCWFLFEQAETQRSLLLLPHSWLNHL